MFCISWRCDETSPRSFRGMTALASVNALVSCFSSNRPFFLFPPPATSWLPSYSELFLLHRNQVIFLCFLFFLKCHFLHKVIHEMKYLTIFTCVILVLLTLRYLIFWINFFILNFLNCFVYFVFIKVTITVNFNV